MKVRFYRDSHVEEYRGIDETIYLFYGTGGRCLGSVTESTSGKIDMDIFEDTVEDETVAAWILDGIMLGMGTFEQVARYAR